MFNPATGEFTAPIDGLYVASITLKQQSDGCASLGVVHKSNNDVKCLGVVETEEISASSSKTFFFWMIRGDKLYSFRHYATADKWQCSYFSCFLLSV